MIVVNEADERIEIEAGLPPDLLQSEILRIVSHLETVQNAYDEAKSKGAFADFVDEFATTDPDDPVIVCALQKPVVSTMRRGRGQSPNSIAELVYQYRDGGSYRRSVESPVTVTVQELVTDDGKKSTIIDMKAYPIRISRNHNGSLESLVFHNRAFRFMANDEGYEIIDLSYSGAVSRVHIKFDNWGNITETIFAPKGEIDSDDIKMVLNVFEMTLATQFK